MTGTEPGPVAEVRVLTRENGRELFEWIAGKAYYEPDGSISGLTVFTPAGRVKAEFGDVIVRWLDGTFGVMHRPVRHAVDCVAVLAPGSPCDYPCPVAGARR